jgi:hypothetical protein
MMFTTMAGGVASAAAACVLGAGLGACVAPAGARPRRAPRASHGQAGAQLRGCRRDRRRGDPHRRHPRHLRAATSSSWHALAVHCASAAQCDEAIARMRAAGTVYVVVESEGRKARSGS